MTSADFLHFTIQIAVLLACALAGGHALRRLGQPAVLGEMLGGIVLGPTLVGALFPELWAQLFPGSPAVAAARDGVIKLGMILFLFVAGLEIDLGQLRRFGWRAISIGLVGTVVPIGVGVALVEFLPASFFGPAAETHRLALGLFVGMNLANSANPVIARILLDLGLLDREFGAVVMSATVVDDLVNWCLFALVLGMIRPPEAPTSASIAGTAAVVVGGFAVVLLAGRWLGPPVLGWLRSRVSWPTTYIGAVVAIVLLVAAAAEAVGVHAFLGAFLAGTAIGGLEPERHDAREAVTHVALGFFAPIYFVSMGIGTDFAAHFDLLLVAVVFAVACASKLGSVLLGARLAGMPANRETWAIGFALNARGATGIILAGIGREHGLIDDRLYVGMVVMALATSLVSGPAIRLLLGLGSVASRRPAAESP